MWLRGLRIGIVTAVAQVTAMVQVLVQELPHAKSMAKKKKKKIPSKKQTKKSGMPPKTPRQIPGVQKIILMKESIAQVRAILLEECSIFQSMPSDIFMFIKLS